MKTKLLLASVAALSLASAVAWAGVNAKQTDTGGMCWEFSSGVTQTDAWCWSPLGVFDFDPATTAANSATTNDMFELKLDTPVDTTGTNVHNALTIDMDEGNATGGTNTVVGIQIDALTGDAENTTRAINIGAMTGTAGTENAIVIGSGWDAGLSLASPMSSTGNVSILTPGNLIVGAGTPGVTQDGEDAYVTGTLEVDGAARFDGTTTFSGVVVDTLQMSISISGQCKVGATAGWVITAGTNMSHATLPAAQTGSTLACPLSSMPVGSTITAVALAGQVESAGNTVTLAISVRKLTNAAADNVDAELTNGADNLGAGVTADTILSAANLGVSAMTEVIAADEALYVLITGTTAAATDIDATHLLVTYTSG